MNSALTRKLEAAVTELTGPGALKDRLVNAYCDCLEGLDEQDLPEEVQSEFAAMAAAMHSARALPGDTVVRASIRKFSNDDARRYAALVVRAYALRIASMSPALKIPLRSAPRAATPLAAFLAMDNPALPGVLHSKVANRA